MREVGNFRVALAVLIDRLRDMNTYPSEEALKEWDHYRGMDWVEVTTTEAVKALADQKTEGWIIVSSVTGERWGRTFTSKGGAAKSFYAQRGDHGCQFKFKDQSEWVLKRLVVADE